MNEQYTGKSYVRTLQNIAFASQGLPIVAFIYVYLESTHNELPEIIPGAWHHVLFLPVMAVCGLLLYWSYKNYKNLIGQALAENDFARQLDIYKRATTTRYIVYGTCAAFITAGLYLTSYEPFTVLFAIMIILLSAHNPNARRIVRELRLKDHKKDVILQDMEITSAPQDDEKGH